jgi:hypothetical protein
LANPFDSIVYYNYKFITQNLTYQELISRDDLINFYELFFANCPNTSNRGQLNNYITQKLFNDKQYQLFATKADTFAQKNDVLCKFFFGMIFFCNYQLRNTFTENGV